MGGEEAHARKLSSRSPLLHLRTRAMTKMEDFCFAEFESMQTLAMVLLSL